jgi:hypothetical protein
MGKTRKNRKGGGFFGSRLTTLRPPLPQGQTVTIQELENGVLGIEHLAQSENSSTKANLMKYVEKMKQYIQNLKFKTTGEFTQTNPIIKIGGKRSRKQRHRR